jgi:prepilin-type N-terminal cleavage/methylation domain-containing protein
MKKGFTLAEVLITLGIIGVVAALTIPGLIANYQKQETVTRLKKIYSTLSQAFKLSEVDHGEYSNREKGADITDTNAYFEKYWKAYLKGAEACSTAKTCGYTSNTPWKYPSGSNWMAWSVGSDSSRTLFRYGDGVVVFQPRNTSITQPDGTTVPIYVNYLMVDINGPKGPNIVSKDAFLFVLDDKGVLPNGSTCTASDPTGCAGKLMKDGWEIKSDYPW